jgi:hypothetical protein
MCHVSFLFGILRLFIWVLIASGRDHALVTNSFLLLLMRNGGVRGMQNRSDIVCKTNRA